MIWCRVDSRCHLSTVDLSCGTQPREYCSSMMSPAVCKLKVGASMAEEHIEIHEVVFSAFSVSGGCTAGLFNSRPHSLAPAAHFDPARKIRRINFPLKRKRFLSEEREPVKCPPIGHRFIHFAPPSMTCPWPLHVLRANICLCGCKKMLLSTSEKAKGRRRKWSALWDAYLAMWDRSPYSTFSDLNPGYRSNKGIQSEQAPRHLSLEHIDGTYPMRSDARPIKVQSLSLWITNRREL